MRLPTLRGGSAIAALTITAVMSVGCTGDGGSKGPRGEAPTDAAGAIAPIEFAEKNGKEVFNASGIVPVGDSRFIFVDNNTNDALLELQLTPNGQAAKPITRLPLQGLPEKSVDDIEDLALAEIGGRRYIFATPSLSIKPGSKKKGKDDKARPSALLRIAIGEDGSLAAEAMPEFREWFVANVPAIAPTAMNDPDYGGLNIEGLGWDPVRQALLFGIRTPALANGALVVPIRLKDPAGPWNSGNLEAQTPIILKIENVGSDQGVRGMSTGRDGKGFYVVVANATSDDKAGFSVYEWDGNAEGVVKRLPYTFAKKMKPEGLAVGTVGGKPALVFVDDNGGYQVVWL
ncbi:MAG: hypothetical protein IPF82_12525 [Blastocatellia bacterium]|nr:hypothetical protein [Blastocatellia bacterium]